MVGEPGCELGTAFPGGAMTHLEQVRHGGAAHEPFWLLERRQAAGVRGGTDVSAYFIFEALPWCQRRY